MDDLASAQSTLLSCFSVMFFAIHPTTLLHLCQKKTTQSFSLASLPEKPQSFSTTPLVIAVGINRSYFVSMCLRYMHSIQSHCIPGTTFVPHFETLHFISLSFYAYTSAPHSFSSFLPFHSASSIHTVSHYQAIFLRISSGMFLFSTASKPQ